MATQITLTDDQVASVLAQDGTVATLKEQIAALTTDRDAQKARADKAEARLATLNQDIDAVQAKD